MTRPFTGWHMTMIMVAFFAVVIAVNFTMARLAIGSFGGTVVENSYVASQRYNGWLAQARRQAALGWKPAVSTDSMRHILIAVMTAKGALRGARVSATATHPLGALPPIRMAFVSKDGTARSLQALPPGRWLLHIEVVQDKTSAAFDDEIAS